MAEGFVKAYGFPIGLAKQYFSLFVLVHSFTYTHTYHILNNEIELSQQYTETWV